jgi:hypothetical protein
MLTDLACGCRKGGKKDRLCPYHEGYEDGWEDADTVATHLYQAVVAFARGAPGASLVVDAALRFYEAKRRLNDGSDG